MPRAAALIDWSHPLAQRLEHCFLWDGGTWTDAVTGVRMTRQSTGPTNAVTALGAGGFTNANLGGAWAIVPAPTYPSSWTWVGTVPANFGNGLSVLVAHVSGTPDDTGEDIPYLSGFSTSAGARIARLFTGTAGTGFQVFNATSELPLGAPSVLTGVAGVNAQSIWINGAAAGSAASGLTNPTMTAYFTIGGYRSDNFVQCTTVAAMYHRRALTQTEVALLHADPFCMLRW